jgi:hypothetical protein
MGLRPVEEESQMKTTIAAGCFAATLIASSGLAATPQTTPVHRITVNGAERSAEAIEKAFWVCDYVASTRGMQFVSLDLCEAITDLIKTEKFGGDYDEMVEWWRERKPAEHLKLELEQSR